MNIAQIHWVCRESVYTVYNIFCMMMLDDDDADDDDDVEKWDKGKNLLSLNLKI